FHNTTKSRSIQAIQDGFIRFRKGLSSDSATAKTEEFLWIQQAFCFGGIDSIVDVEVDGISWDDDTYSHCLDFSLNGGVASTTATANGIPATNLFTSVSYLTAVFGLNRDDPNYSGVPEVTAYIKGNRIHTVIKTGDSYSLSG